MILTGAFGLMLLLAPTASARTFAGWVAVTSVGTATSTYASVPASAQVAITADLRPGVRQPDVRVLRVLPAHDDRSREPGVLDGHLGIDVGRAVFFDHTGAVGTKSLTATWTEWRLAAGRREKSGPVCMPPEGSATISSPRRPTRCLPLRLRSSPPPRHPQPRRRPRLLPRWTTTARTSSTSRTRRPDPLPGDPYRLDGDRDGMARAEDLPTRVTEGHPDARDRGSELGRPRTSETASTGVGTVAEPRGG